MPSHKKPQAAASLTTFELPFDIEVRTKAGGGSISSGLMSELMESPGDEAGKAAADVLDSFLLAMACEGVDLNDPKIQRALETAVESVTNNLPDYEYESLEDVDLHGD